MNRILFKIVLGDLKIKYFNNLKIHYYENNFTSLTIVFKVSKILLKVMWYLLETIQYFADIRSVKVISDTQYIVSHSISSIMTFWAQWE